MALILIAVVLALVLGHVAPGLLALRRYGWFVGWLHAIGRVFNGPGAWAGRVGLLVAVGLPVVAVGAAQWLLDGHVYGLPLFLLTLVVLVYTWGPRDLDLDVDAVVEARDTESRRAAAAALFPEGGEPSIEGPALVEAVFRCALWRWFGILLWALLLGPAGALLYRLVSLAAQGESLKVLTQSQGAAARLFLALLNWPAAHLMTLGLALAANFDGVLAAWRDWHAQGGRALDIGFLGAAARASVVCELAEEDAYAIDGPAQAPALLELRDAMSLVWRVLLLWLAALAVFVIAGFVN
ncbi:membrane protein [soil metagenome]